MRIDHVILTTLMARTEISTAVRVLADSRLARQDLKILGSLSDARSKRLFGVLANEPELFAAPEPAFSKINLAAKAADVDAEVVWPLVRIAKWTIRALEDEDADVKALVEECEAAGLIAKDDVEKLLSVFRRIAAAKLLRETISDRASVAAVMPTFWDIEFACDLRAANPGEIKSVKRLIPIAILRIRSDEDQPAFILQCTATDLDRLIEAIQDARELLNSIKLLGPAKGET